MKYIVNHIFEIKVKPDPSFLDKKGSIARSLLSNNLNSWQITNDRVVLNNSNNKYTSAFFTINNIGVDSKSPNSTKEFEELAREFIKSAWQKIDTKSIYRLGLRSFYLYETSNFKKTFSLYKDKFLKLSEEDLKCFNSDLIDIGFPLSFLSGDKKIDIMTGPMELAQSSQIFNKENAFKSGVFLDIDYSQQENISPHINLKQINSFIEDGLKKSLETSQLIYNWVKN